MSFSFLLGYRCSLLAEDKFPGGVDTDMEQLFQDFRRLQSAMDTVMGAKLELEKGFASLRHKMDLSPSAVNSFEKLPPSLLSVALREDHPPENLEMEFAEAFPKSHGEVPVQAVHSDKQRIRGTTVVMRADSGASVRNSASHRWFKKGGSV